MDRPEDIVEIQEMCDKRHPHSPEEIIEWLAIHRLLREIDHLREEIKIYVNT